jgi:hypothetical protein
VGRSVLQLCKLLKLRAVAVLRCKPGTAAADERFEAVAEQLRRLGATLVLRDEGSVKVRWLTAPDACSALISQDFCKRGALLISAASGVLVRSIHDAAPAMIALTAAHVSNQKLKSVVVCHHLKHNTARPAAVLQTQLQAHRFFGRPKLALDAVGGDSAGRIAEALEQVNRYICMPCNSRKAAASMLLADIQMGFGLCDLFCN